MLKLFPGPYRMQAYTMRGTVLASNKCTYNSYRAPWAMETWLHERVLNLIARELGLDPADIRRRNFFSGAKGDRMITGMSLTGITAAQSLERALLVADYAKLAEQREAARVEGRYLGIGFATCIEAAPGPSKGALAGMAAPKQCWRQMVTSSFTRRRLRVVMATKQRFRRSPLMRWAFRWGS